jgi:transposase
MAAAQFPDPLWDFVEPFLPIPPRRPQGGRPRVSDRACLTGIVFVLRSGIPWQMLPQKLGCGSGMTCWHNTAGTYSSSLIALTTLPANIATGEADGHKFSILSSSREAFVARSTPIELGRTGLQTWLQKYNK